MRRNLDNLRQIIVFSTVNKPACYKTFQFAFCPSYRLVSQNAEQEHDSSIEGLDHDAWQIFGTSKKNPHSVECSASISTEHLNRFVLWYRDILTGSFWVKAEIIMFSVSLLGSVDFLECRKAKRRLRRWCSLAQSGEDSPFQRARPHFSKNRHWSSWETWWRRSRGLSRTVVRLSTSLQIQMWKLKS